MSSASHPVLHLLQHYVDTGVASGAMKAVVQYGRLFVGKDRPRGYRLRAPKKCFLNAGDLSLRGRGEYVEGFARVAGGIVAQHAWLTLDGTDAIDVTWRRPAGECYYYGIKFSNAVLEKFSLRTGTWGPLLAPDEQEQVLRDAGLLG